jgi:hypothetical protein
MRKLLTVIFLVAITLTAIQGYSEGRDHVPRTEQSTTLEMMEDQPLIMAEDMIHVPYTQLIYIQGINTLTLEDPALNGSISAYASGTILLPDDRSRLTPHKLPFVRELRCGYQVAQI